uniref:Uncharacterized protein n=1 Tax=Oryza brachyantha TaxID=4533 RepID=J3NBK4_ORYBR
MAALPPQHGGRNTERGRCSVRPGHFIEQVARRTSKARAEPALGEDVVASGGRKESREANGGVQITGFAFDAGRLTGGSVCRHDASGREHHGRFDPSLRRLAPPPPDRPQTNLRVVRGGAASPSPAAAVGLPSAAVIRGGGGDDGDGKTQSSSMIPDWAPGCLITLARPTQQHRSGPQVWAARKG